MNQPPTTGFSIVKSVVAIGIGTLPGIGLVLYGNAQVGVPMALLIGFVGFVLTLPGVSPKRTGKLMTAVLLSYNLPFVKGAVLEWVDDEESLRSGDPADGDLSEQLVAWLSPIVENRRGWLVLTGVVVGSLSGAAIGIHDVLTIDGGGRGVVLPLQSSRDSLEVQAVLLTIALFIWGGGFTSLLASSSYRRPVLLAAGLSGFIFGCVGATVGKPVEMAVFFSTGAVAVALLCAALLDPGRPEDVCRVFVYGTLKQGQPRERMWPRKPVNVQKAITEGRLYDLDAYPAMTDGSDLIVGEMWTFEKDDVVPTLEALDVIEHYGVGDVDLYTRLMIHCQTDCGEIHVAHAYYYANPGELNRELQIQPDDSGYCQWPVPDIEG